MPQPLSNTEYYEDFLTVIGRTRNPWELMWATSMHNWSVLERLRIIRCPVKLFHGDVDKLSKFETGLKIYNALGSLEERLECTLF